MNIPVNVTVSSATPAASDVVGDIILTGRSLTNNGTIFSFAVTRRDLQAAIEPWATNHQVLPARLLFLEE